MRILLYSLILIVSSQAAAVSGHVQLRCPSISQNGEFLSSDPMDFRFIIPRTSAPQFTLSGIQSHHGKKQMITVNVAQNRSGATMTLSLTSACTVLLRSEIINERLIWKLGQECVGGAPRFAECESR